MPDTGSDKTTNIFINYVGQIKLMVQVEHILNLIVTSDVRLFSIELRIAFHHVDL